MIDINFNELSVDELISMLSNLEDFVKFLESEILETEKVINGNE